MTSNFKKVWAQNMHQQSGKMSRSTACLQTDLLECAETNKTFSTNIVILTLN